MNIRKSLFGAALAAVIALMPITGDATQNFGVTILNPGGTQSALNVTTAGAIKSNVSSPTQPGKLREVVVINWGTTSGSFVFYDVNFIGAYSGTTQYYPGQGVTSGGTVYVCILASLGNATSSSTYWTAASPVWQVIYNAATLVGTTYTLNLPFLNGIYLGTVPGGSPVLNVFFD